MKQAKTNRLFIASWCSVALFVICYLSISIYNRHCADDYDSIRDVNMYGIFGAIKHCYVSWEGSFTQGIVNYSLMAVFKNSVSLFWYNALSLLCLFGSCFFAASALNKSFFNFNRSQLWLMSGSLLSALFFTSPSLAEVWFWFVGSASYLWPLTLLFLSLSFIIRSGESIYNVVFACVFCFLFAGSRLNYPVIFGFYFGLYLLWDFVKRRKINSRLLLPFLFLILGLIVYVIAPGNGVRRSYTEDNVSFNLLTVAIQLVKGFARIVLYNNLFQLPYMAVILSPVLFLATALYDKVPEKIKSRSITKTAGALLFLYLGAMFFHTAIMYFALGDAGGSPRTRLLLHLIFCVSYAYLYFLAGLKYRIAIQKNSAMLFAALIISCFLFIYKTAHELPIDKTYAAAYDQRMDLILAAKNNYSRQPVETLYLPHLPPSQSTIYNDPTFNAFRQIGVWNYFAAVPNGSIHNSEIHKRRPKELDHVIDVFREDHINMKLETTFGLPFRVDLDTIRGVKE